MTSALPAYAFDHVRTTVRQADVRYSYIAHIVSHQLSTKLTHHARKLAHRRGLNIDIAKAKDCPQGSVSEKPLPEIVLPSPPLVLVRQTPVYAPNYRMTQATVKIPDAPALACRPLPEDVPEEEMNYGEEDMIISPLESDSDEEEDDARMSVSPMSADHAKNDPRILWRIRCEPYVSFDSYIESAYSH